MKNFTILFVALLFATLASCSKLTEEELYGEYPDNTDSTSDIDASDTTDSGTEEPTDTANTDSTDTATEDPSESTDPAEPADSTEEPTTEPTDEPIDPTTEPTEPTEPTDGNEPDNDTESGDDNESDDDSEPNDGNEPDNDTESGDDNEPDGDSEPTDGNEPDNDTESGDDNEPDDDSEPNDGNEPDNDTEPTEPACVPSCKTVDGENKVCGYDGCDGICGSGCAANEACNKEQTDCVPYECKKITVTRLSGYKSGSNFTYNGNYKDSDDNTNNDLKLLIKHPANLSNPVDLSDFKYSDCSKENGAICLYIQNSGTLYFQQNGTIDINSLNTSNAGISAPISNVRLVETGFVSYNTSTYEIPGGSCIEILNQSLDYFAY
ncbi:hypothetical protein IKS86_09940 [bacterium]|nr:hypothetical protein [bacterium]